MNNFILGLDIGSFEIKAIISKYDGDDFSICGIGKTPTMGIRKGVVTNIEQASQAIKKAVSEATKSSGTSYNKVVVSISGAYTKYVKSSGVINIPENEIGINEIKRVMRMAENNANIPNDYEKLHVLPYNFKVDDQDYIEDPLGMSGSRLEASTHIIIAQKSSIKNLEKSVQMAGIKIDNIVSSGYASAIATLTKEEKELGVCVIDMGASTSDIVIHIGNSIVHNDVLLIGSINVTNDIANLLHTPISNAEEIKINYATLQEGGCKSIELPEIGNENKKNKVDLEVITDIIYARIEETLLLLQAKMKETKYFDMLNAGIVLTGGLSKFVDILEMSASFFDNKPVRVAASRITKGLYDVTTDPSNTSAIGLCLYGSGYFTPYEIDSNGKLRYKDEILKPESNSYEDEIKEALQEKISGETDSSEIILEKNLSNKSKKENFLHKIWRKIIDSF